MTLPPKRHAIAIGVFTVCAILAAAQLPAEPLSVGELGTPTPDIDKQIQEVQDAITRFRARQFDDAYELLKEAAKKHAKLPPAEIMMAQLFAQVRQGGGVRLWLERAVIEAPKDPEALVIMGDLALRGRRVTEADLLYTKAASLIPNFENAERKKLLEPRVNGGQAAVAEARTEWPTAEKYLRDWLKLDPDNTAALQRLGRALFRQKKAQEAKDTLEKAAKADPKVLNWAAQLALLYEQSEDPEMAKKWMKYAIQLKPKDLRTRLVAAQWSLETNQLTQAQEQAAAAMQLDPKSLDAKVLRGVVALFQKEFKAAEMYFESAHLQSPGNFAASNNLALALCEQDDESKKRRAFEYAGANFRANPKVVEAASTYGWVLYKLGRLDDADRVLNSVLRAGNFSADTAYYIARVAADKGRTEEAKGLLTSALKSKRPFTKRQEAQLLWEKLSR